LKAYAPIELYIMGLLPADSVPAFQVAYGAEWVVEAAGIFRADSIRTVTMDAIVRKHGARDPAAEVPREFRAIYVVVSSAPLSDGARDRIHVDVEEFSRRGPREERRYFNFWEATGGRATLMMDGLSGALRDRAPRRGPGGGPAAGESVAGRVAFDTTFLIDFQRERRRGGDPTVPPMRSLPPISVVATVLLVASAAGMAVARYVG
jgi:hypothetical protein